MIKKSISLLSALMLTVSISACSSNTDNTPTATTMPSVTVTEPDSIPTSEATVSSAFEEIEIVNNENCTFTIKSIDEDAMFGYTLKVFLENKTDLELMFSLSDVSVNGFMCDPVFAAAVTPGMKANETVTFLNADFMENGITDVTDITFTLRIYDSNDWMAEPVAEDTFTVYPMGEDAVVPYEREAKEADMILFENDDCTMIITGFDPDNLFGYKMNVYLENNTDKTLMFSVGEASVNGFMCDPYWAVTVAPGKRSNTAITWLDSAFAENGITEVESITLPVRVYDSNDYMADDILNETFTVNP